MSNLYSIQFWFNLYPPKLTPLFNYTLIFATTFFLLGAILFTYLKKSKGESKNFYLEGFRRLYEFSLTQAIIGFLFIFFNYQAIPFFSARFWYLIWFVIIVVWLYHIFNFFSRKIPEKKKKAENEEKYHKYLP